MRVKCYFDFYLCIANEVFQFFVRAEDSGVPPLSTETPVDVLILDLQERSPVFERTSSKYFISESAPVGKSEAVLSPLLFALRLNVSLIRYHDCESEGFEWRGAASLLHRAGC